MTHKFTQLFLGILICLSAAPAQSTESWGPLAVAYGAHLGIGLGSAIAYVYGSAMAREFLKPGNVEYIVIGSDDPEELEEKLRNNQTHLKPIFFPKGLRPRDAFGIFPGFIKSKKLNRWADIAANTAGPLAGVGFCMGMAALANYFFPQSLVSFICCIHITDNLGSLAYSNGKYIQESLGVSKLQYDAVAIPTLLYTLCKIAGSLP